MLLILLVQLMTPEMHFTDKERAPSDEEDEDLRWRSVGVACFKLRNIGIFQVYTQRNDCRQIQH